MTAYPTDETRRAIKAAEEAQRQLDAVRASIRETTPAVLELAEALQTLGAALDYAGLAMTLARPPSAPQEPHKPSGVQQGHPHTDNGHTGR